MAGKQTIANDVGWRKIEERGREIGENHRCNGENRRKNGRADRSGEDGLASSGDDGFCIAETSGKRGQAQADWGRRETIWGRRAGNREIA